MEDNTTTYTTIIDTQVTGTGDLKDLGDAAEKNDEKFVSLRRQIRETTIALQQLADQGKQDTKEFKDLSNQLDDLNDQQARVAFQSAQIEDKLAALPGPIGQIGQSFKGAKEAIDTFGKGIATALGVVGLIISAFLALKESLSRTEEGQKKLTQITEAFTKIMNGLFAVIEPIAMALADLVINILKSDTAMKIISKTAGVLAAVLSGAFTVIKELAIFVGNNLVNTFKTAAGIIGGFGKVIGGVFTFDLDKIKEGLADVGKTVTTGVSNFVNNAKDRFKGIKDGVVSAYNGAEAAVVAGSKRMTEAEKKAAEEKRKKDAEAAKAAEEARKKALEDKLKAMEAEDKLDEARLAKMKENALAEAKTEEEKLLVSESFAKKTYELKKKELEDKQKLYGPDTNEYKNYQADLITLESGYIKESSDLKKQKADADKKALEDMLKDIQTFNDKVAEIGLAALKDETLKAEVAREQKRNKDIEALKADKEFQKLTIEEQNSFLRQIEIGFQNDIAKIREDARVKENEKLLKAFDEQLRILELTSENLVQGTKAYFESRAAILDVAEQKELAKLDITEKEKTAIKEKYVKLRKQLDDDEIASYGRIASATIDALASVTSALAASYDEDAKNSKEAFETRKKLQRATAIMSAASGIIQILTQPSTLPSPFDWIVKGINAVALGVATAVQLRNINNTQFEGGGTVSSATTGVKTGAPSVSLPRLEQMGTPTIQGTQGGTNPTSQIADTLAARTNKPIKAYVVSGDVTSQQALDRRTTRAATFSG